MMDDFVYKRNLLLIQRLVIDEGGKRLHCRFMVQLGDFGNQQTEGHTTKLMGLLQNESGATAPFSVEKWFCAVFWGTNC